MERLIEKIQQVLSKRKVTFSEFADHIGIPEGQLKQAFQNNSIEIRTLERISKELKIPLYRFFREPIGDLLESASDHPVYANITQDELTHLKMQLEVAQREIMMLKRDLEDRNRVIDELNNKINTKKA